MGFQLEQQSDLNEYAPMTTIFLNNGKNIQLTWLHVTISQRRLSELLKKLINNQDQLFSKKEQKTI